jgi:diguanylate cyclase (GGDEF)-like protein/PAS domain S-box-containing protein
VTARETSKLVADDVLPAMTQIGKAESGDRHLWKERFRSAFETAGHGMAIVGLDGTFIDVNQSLCSILGYGEAELRSRNFQSVTHPDDLTADIDHVARLLTGEDRSYEMEKRYLRQDGSTIWARLSVGLIRGPDGLPLYFVSQIHDITAHRRELEARRQAEAAQKRAQRLTHLGYYRWSRTEQRVFDFNDEYLQILGLTRDSTPEVLTGVEPYLHPDDRERVVGIHRAAEREGRGYHLEFRIVRPDGSVHHLLDLNEPDAGSADRPETWSGTVQDITLQKQQEEALQAFQARLELALETAGAAYWELDLVDQRYSAGPEYFAILGYAIEEASEDKKSWLALIHPDDRAKVDQAHLLPPADRANHELEYRIMAKGGRWRWFLSHFRACAFNDLGRPVRLLGIDIDITAQRQRETELLEARAQVANASRRAKIAFWRQQFGFGEFVWSEAAGEIFGRPSADLPITPEDFLRLVHREDAERVRSTYVRARAQSRGYDLEYRIAKPDGAITWLQEIGEVEQAGADGRISLSGTLQDITERKNLEARLEQLATVDELTGAQNRRAILAQAQIELRRARRFKRALSFLFLDIDHFKQINDQFGHGIGDIVLSTLSAVCRGALRPSDIFARYGGEEFLVMLPETDIVQAAAVAQRLTVQLRQTEFSANPSVGGLTVSVGIAVIRGPEDTLEALLERIDRALYRAKALGRDRIEIET